MVCHIQYLVILVYTRLDIATTAQQVSDIRPRHYCQERNIPHLLSFFPSSHADCASSRALSAGCVVSSANTQSAVSLLETRYRDLTGFLCILFSKTAFPSMEKKKTSQFQSGRADIRRSAGSNILIHDPQRQRHSRRSRHSLERGSSCRTPNDDAKGKP